MRVITYGTFDLFHEGHRRLLERAKALGDHLIVGVTTDNYDDSRGKLNVQQSLMDRIANVQNSGLADEIIIEEYEGQKVQDMQKHDVDIFAIGSDWLGKFDYLNDYCKVVYLDRTKGVSSTQSGRGRGAAGRHRRRRTDRHPPGRRGALRQRDQRRGGLHAQLREAKAFAEKCELQWANETFEDLLEHVDAVYIASPHASHYGYARAAIEAGVHVLCEKPMTLTRQATEELYRLAAAREVVLVEAIKTAFAPGFQRMVAVARIGTIGTVRSVDATFTKLVKEGRELHGEDGGSISELATYPLLAIVKLLGTDYTDVRTHSFRPEGSEVELYSRIDITYKHAIASARTGIGVKAEGELVVAGTRGYVYVPAPWWLTEYFEARFENPAHNKKYYYKFDGDGLRYELAEFAWMIRNSTPESFKLRAAESIAIADIIERARAQAVPFG
ncbi:MAG: Gfo/Idh/MocA family oxidoreductase [Micropruina sp.]